MKNTFGNSITLTLFGESHGREIGAVLDGIAPGIRVDTDYISSMLSRRRPVYDISTSRHEKDEFSIVSGVYNGFTTGTPICITIPNTDVKSSDYSALDGIARPGHSDYPAYLKYHGYEDRRGGGHFSGRITAPIVACGAILKLALENKGIFIGSHLSRCAGICDDTFTDFKAGIELLKTKQFPVLSDEKGREMTDAIKKAKDQGDSVGGVVEGVIVGLPGGVGEPWFDSIESMLSHGLFSVPGIKGVEFGDGFSLSDSCGSSANDAYRYENGEAVTLTNHSGGIGGGISNGMPILFRCAVKPTSSISKIQPTVNYTKKENTELSVSGRHDACFAPRVCPVADAIASLVVSDLLSERFGTDYLSEGRS